MGGIPVSTLRAIVQIQGVTKANSQLTALQGGLTRSASAAKSATASTSTLGKTHATAATQASRQAKAGTAAAGANSKVASTAKAASGATSTQTGASRAATAATVAQTKATHGLTAASGGAVAVAGRVGKTAKVGMLGVAGAAAIGVKSYADFDRKMTESLAIMDDISGPMRAKMEKAAREVGKTTTASASEAGQGYFYLASAGWDAQQSLKGMPRVAKFAQAGNFDLATATDLATDAQSALGMAADDAGENLKNLNRVQDVLVKTNTLANATVEQFSESLTSKGGAALKAVGKDIEEGSAVLAAFADQGIKGRLAGEGLQITMRELQRAAIEKAGAFRKAGVAVFDEAGEMRNMGVIIGELEGHLDGMSDKQTKVALGQMGFTEESIKFIQTLQGTSTAIKGYERELRDAAGTTDRVAEKQLKGFSGAWIKVKSHVDDAVLSIGEDLAPSLEEIADILGSKELTGAEKFREVLRVIGDEAERQFARAATAAANAGPQVVGNFARGFASAWSNMNPFAKLLTTAAIIRMVGGKGAVTGAGMAIGRLLGVGVASGAISAAGAGAAGAGAAGAAGGIVGGMRGKVLPVAKRVGLAGVGIALADATIDEFARRSRERSDDLIESLEAKGQTKILGIGVPDAVGNPLGRGQMGLPDVGSLDAEGKAANDLKRLVEDIRKGRQLITAEQYKGIEAQVRALNLTGQQKRLWDRTLETLRQGSNLKVGVDLQMDPKKLARIQEGLGFLKAGFGATTKDILKVSQRNMRLVAQTFGVNTKQGRKLAAENLRATAGAFRKNMDLAGNRTKEGMARVKQLIRKADLLDPSRKQARAFGDEWAKGMTRAKRFNKRGLDDMIADAKKMPAPMRKVAVETWLSQIREARKSGRIGKEEFRKYRSRVLSEFTDIETGSKRKSKDTATGVIANVARLVNQSGKGFDILVDNANGALDAFGVDELTYNVKKFSGGQKKQTGGFIVPGTGSGDTFQTALPPGAFVMNRNATEKLGLQRGGVTPVALEPRERVFMPDEVRKVGRRNLEAANAAVPRFQEGGPVGLQAGGFPELAPPARTVANQLAGMGFQPTSTLRNTTTHHGTGHAIDYGDSANSMPRLWGVLRPKAPQFAELFGPSFLPGDTLMQYGRGFTDAGLQADHEDHIHVAILGALAGGLGMPEIKRLLLSGPDGPLKDLGQGALDKVHKAANKYVRENATVGHAGGDMMFTGGGGEYGKAALMNLWTQIGGNPAVANLAAAVALAESGGNSAASNHNTNGTIDRGLWQINSIHGALSTFDAAGNARAAKVISGNGSDWSPWVAYTNGNYAQFLQQGGIVQQLAQGGVVGGDGASIADYMPMLQGGGSVPKEVRERIKKWNALPDKKRMKRADKRADWDGNQWVGSWPGKGHGYDMFEDGAIGREAERKGDPLARQIRQVAKVVRKQPKRQKRNQAVKGLLGNVRKIGIPTSKVADLEQAANRAGDAANRAQALTRDLYTPDGDQILLGSLGADDPLRHAFLAQYGAGEGDDQRPVQELGKVQGRTELQWVREQMGRLLDWRNEILRVQEIVAERKARVAKLIKQTKKQIRQIGAQMRKAAKRKARNERTIRQRERQIGRINKQIGKWQDKPRRHRGQIKAAREKIKTMRGKNRANRQTIKQIDQAQGARERAKDTLSGRVMKSLTNRRRLLGTAESDMATNLEQVQGPVTNTQVLKVMPPMGVLSGQIFDAQVRERELTDKPARIAASATGGTEDNAEMVRLLQQQVRIANQRTAVSDAQFGVLRDFDSGFAGMFAKGGVIPKGMWGIAGETGQPEIVQGPATIHNPAQTQQMLGGGGAGGGRGDLDVKVIVEDHRTRVEVNGQEVRAIVRDETRKASRTATASGPGRGGGLIG